MRISTWKVIDNFSTTSEEKCVKFNYRTPNAVVESFSLIMNANQDFVILIQCPQNSASSATFSEALVNTGFLQKPHTVLLGNNDVFLTPIFKNTADTAYKKFLELMQKLEIKFSDIQAHLHQFITRFSCPLNGTQINIIDSTFDSYLEDINALPPLYAIKTLRATFSDNFSAEQEKFFSLLNIGDAIQFIRKIFFHPFPQNRAVNYPYFGEPNEEDIVVFKDENGLPAFEPRGLLSLTARNDTTAAPVTRQAVINYIQKKIENFIVQHTQSLFHNACDIQDLMHSDELALLAERTTPANLLQRNMAELTMMATWAKQAIAKKRQNDFLSKVSVKQLFLENHCERGNSLSELFHEMRTILSTITEYEWTVTDNTYPINPDKSEYQIIRYLERANIIQTTMVAGFFTKIVDCDLKQLRLFDLKKFQSEFDAVMMNLIIITSLPLTNMVLTDQELENASIKSCIAKHAIECEKIDNTTRIAWFDLKKVEMILHESAQETPVGIVEMVPARLAEPSTRSTALANRYLDRIPGFYIPTEASDTSNQDNFHWTSPNHSVTNPRGPALFSVTPPRNPPNAINPGERPNRRRRPEWQM